MENRIEVLSCADAGWHVALESGEWRLGYLNYCDALSKDKLDGYERHHLTDEVFVLLKGEATLFVGDGEADFGTPHAYVMQPGKLYNIRKMAWHTQFMSRDCSILVIENRGTGLDNSDVVAFDADFRAKLYAAL